MTGMTGMTGMAGRAVGINRARSARAALASLVVVLLCAAIVSPAHAQARRSDPAPPGDALAAPTSPAELQRLFDAYALVQAQDMLQLSDAQYAPFLARLRALQAARRRVQLERSRIVQDLRRLADRNRAETVVRDRIADRLKALRDVETRGLADVQQAVDELDAVLDPIQQARLRVLEEQIERRKLELLVRARQGARARRLPR